MKKKSVSIVAAAACWLLVSSGAAQNKGRLDPYKTWLEEDVAYLITPLEKDVFRKLQTDRERDVFIEAFWKHRDPTPGTPENEFKTEHFRRINHANRYYGRTSIVPGWRTDRGRIYIILGEPNDIQNFDGRANLYPCEVWFYQDKANLGLPPGFNVLFFKRSGQGDFELYSPTKDGPQSLLVSYSGTASDYLQAYSALREIDSNLADVSLSLIAGESGVTPGTPSLVSDSLLQKIEDVPRRQVEDRYAEKFFQYRGMVDVEYSANYIESDALVKIAKEPSGMYFVSYAIEPKQLSMNAYQDKYYTTLKINGTVVSLEGAMIYQFDKSITVNLDENQMKSAGRQPFDFQDIFPLIPGTFKLSILVKNEVSKEFTSLERTLVIPGETPALQMTSPILGYKTIRADDRQKSLKPFRIGSNDLYCEPGRVFTKKETLVVAFQVLGMSERQKRSGLLRYVFSRDGQATFEKERSVESYAEIPDILEEFPLADFVPAYYTLTVSFRADGRELVAGSEEFAISYMEAVPRPWFQTKLMPEALDPIYALVIGSQLFRTGRAVEAQRYLERAAKEKPDSVDAALALARVSLALKNFSRVPALLAPFMSPPQPPRYEVLLFAGLAYEKLGNYSRALEILDQTVTQFGISADLLNAIGECHVQSGRPKDALAAWEKSLAINPNQPEIVKKTEMLKPKK